MPETTLYLYQEKPGEVPVLDWLREVLSKNEAAFAKCVAALRRLRDFGHELQRPHADYLEDDIYELRVRKGRVNYRILYFFHGRNVAVLAHAITKEDKIPRTELGRAKERKERFRSDPDAHTFEGEIE